MPRFEKGVSGNPSGKPKIPDDIKQMLKSAAPSALTLLIETCADTNVRRDLRIDCAKTILDRAYGKPAQAVSVDASVGATVTATAMTADEMLEAIREAAKAMGEIKNADGSDSSPSESG